MRGHRDIAADGSVIRLTDEATEESDRPFVLVWLELGLRFTMTGKPKPRQRIDRPVIQVSMHAFYRCA